MCLRLHAVAQLRRWRDAVRCLIRRIPRGRRDVFNPLAPRTGAKRYDPTRTLHLNIPLPSSRRCCFSRLDRGSCGCSANTRPPLTLPRTATRAHPSVQAPRLPGHRHRLRSIHLHSDPEDNLDPGLTSAQRKKLLKNRHARRRSTVSSLDTARVATGGGGDTC